MLRLPNLGGAIPVDAILGLDPAEAERRIIDEVGSTSLFGARFRMNAARALLLPRGNPRRRMPLWLQRLKALDLLQTVQEFPSFPILVETYRDVLQDAFDMPALATVLGDLKRGAIRVRVVEVDRPSPFATSLMFGFVMDWLYVDDTPRAEQRAAYLSLDRALLDEVMGAEGADPETSEAIAEVLAVRRGTAANRRARNADELAALIDRAGDLTIDEARERVAEASRWARGDPLVELLQAERVVEIDIPTSSGNAQRLILTETFGRYAAAFGADAITAVRAGAELTERPVADVVPPALREATLNRAAARREVLARWLTLSGPVSIDEVRARYDFAAQWIAARVDEWQRDGKLVRGHFGSDRTVPRWCSRRVLEHARRRALAVARQQITAVGLPDFVAFLQRWQHLDPRDTLGGSEGVGIAVRQLTGLARPAVAWERDYLPGRVRPYDANALTTLTQSGAIVWIGGGSSTDRAEPQAFTALRFVERGTAARWLEPGEPGRGDRPSATTESPELSEPASKVLEALRSYGASFVTDVQTATGLTMLALRDALRELAATGLVTNDSAEALREVVRFRPLLRGTRPDDPDPTRWLPADFSPTPGRPIVQRRPNLRRLPKWRRPDLPGGRDGWVGRWSLVRTPAILGPAEDDETRAEAIARVWLDRYGIVTRDWWRRERPAVSWRLIYRELRRDYLPALDHQLLLQAVAHSKVALCGYGGDPLLRTTPLVDLFEKMSFPQVAGQVVKFLWSYRRLPPLGIRRRVKKWLGLLPPPEAFPPWIDPDLAKRLDLRARWDRVQNRPEVRDHVLRGRGYAAMTGPFWPHRFETCDPGWTSLDGTGSLVRRTVFLLPARQHEPPGAGESPGRQEQPAADPESEPHAAGER